MILANQYQLYRIPNNKSEMMASPFFFFFNVLLSILYFQGFSNNAIIYIPCLFKSVSATQGGTTANKCWADCHIKRPAIAAGQLHF